MHGIDWEFVDFGPPWIIRDLLDPQVYTNEDPIDKWRRTGAILEPAELKWTFEEALRPLPISRSEEVKSHDLLDEFYAEYES